MDVKLTDKHKERIKLLVDALRSGEYKQGTGILRSGDRFCCLGVACDIYRKTAKKGKWKNDLFVTDKVVELNYLPTAVSTWFGFQENNPYIGNDPYIGNVRAAVRNDEDGWTFKAIARGFERTYLGKGKDVTC